MHFSFLSVLMTLKNHPHFAEAFQCKPGTPMNPSEKCQVWWRRGELKIIFLKFEFREKYLPNIIMKLTPTQGVQYLWLYLTFSYEADFYFMTIL